MAANRECIYQGSDEQGTVSVFINRGKAATYSVELNDEVIHTEALRFSWQFHQREAIVVAEKRMGWIVTGRPTRGTAFEGEIARQGARWNNRWKGSVINP
jgi:hypothetical protein